MAATVLWRGLWWQLTKHQPALGGSHMCDVAIRLSLSVKSISHSAVFFSNNKSVQQYFSAISNEQQGVNTPLPQLLGRR